MIAGGDCSTPGQEILQTGHLAQAEGGLHVCHFVVEGAHKCVLLIVLA